ncbi:MAG: 7-carboxy-7-deazaguanine synthase QueE [Saprospiraceae bacterium]
MSIMLKLARLHGEPEIFYSIQGEGRSLGRTSVFVRTSLCNLHCAWCDTDYTWNWTGTPFTHVHDADPDYRKFDKKEWLVHCTIEEVAARVAAFPCRNVVLTGGEPMMQQDALAELMRHLKNVDPDYRFEVETNATYLPTPDFDALIDQYNASPKLDNSGNPKRLREKPAVYRFLSEHPKAGFKFVVAETADLHEVLDLIKRYNIAPEKIWLMPEGATREALALRREWIVEICKTHGFNYTDRLHVQIWGSKKGV